MKRLSLFVGLALTSAVLRGQAADSIHNFRLIQGCAIARSFVRLRRG